MQWRLPLTILAGLAFALALFGLLRNMVSEPVNVHKTVTATNIQFTMLNRDMHVRTKVRKKPERLPPPKVPHVPKMKISSHTQTHRSRIPNLAPQIGLGGVSGGGIGVGGSVVGTIKTKHPVPVVRIPPTYPPRAARANVEGWVLVGFTITTSGRVTNIHIIDAKHRGFFGAAALRAIRQWRYRPRQHATHATQRITFKLN